VSEDTDEIDPGRSRNGIAPNWIHSLDATAAHLTVYSASMKGVSHFRMIHDSFATHAADMPVLAATLREVYADIFSADQVTRLRQELRECAPEGVILPVPPSFGTLDPNQVKEAEYFFG
jgi:DNA-directed RNA polymerase